MHERHVSSLAKPGSTKYDCAEVTTLIVDVSSLRFLSNRPSDMADHGSEKKVSSIAPSVIVEELRPKLLRSSKDKRPIALMLCGVAGMKAARSIEHEPRVLIRDT